LIVYFQTFETFISLLTCVLAFAIILDTLSKNKRYEHIFPINPLMTVGTIKLNFWLSNSTEIYGRS